jgi:hypothetical protein
MIDPPAATSHSYALNLPPRKLILTAHVGHACAIKSQRWVEPPAGIETWRMNSANGVAEIFDPLPTANNFLGQLLAF